MSHLLSVPKNLPCPSPLPGALLPPLGKQLAWGPRCPCHPKVPVSPSILLTVIVSCSVSTSVFVLLFPLAHPSSVCLLCRLKASALD